MLKIEVLKEKKGVIVSDAIVAILLILLFAGITTSLMVNIVLESSKIKMNSQQIDFATELLEYAQEIPYENVTQDNLISYINNKNQEGVSAGETVEALVTPYKIGIQVETYTPEDESLPKLDIIKVVTITVQSDLNNKTYTTTMSTIKKATTEEVKNKLTEYTNQ